MNEHRGNAMTFTDSDLARYIKSKALQHIPRETQEYALLEEAITRLERPGFFSDLLHRLLELYAPAIVRRVHPVTD